MPFTRRSAFTAVAALVAAPFLANRASAQGATNAPAGGIPSSTAPSNSEGAPAGGSGVIGGTRTPGAPRGATPDVAGVPGTSETTHTTRRRRRRRHRSTRSTTTTTPQ